MQIEQARHLFFKGLSNQEFTTLLIYLEEKKVEKDEYLIHEGDKGEEVYLIVDGEFKILKKDDQGQNHQIGTIYSGECVGELVLLNHNSRVASVQASQPSRILSINISKLRDRSPEIVLKLTENFLSLFSDRLDKANQLVISSFRTKFFNSQKLNSIQSLIIKSFVCLTSYQVFLQSVVVFTGLLELHALMVVEFPALLMVSIISLYVIKGSGHKIRSYGFNLRSWKKSFLESLIFSGIFMSLIVLLKWILIHNTESFANAPLFQLGAGVETSSLSKESSMFTKFSGVLYILSCPLQEFLFRGFLQTSLHRLFTGKNRIFLSILISNLFFAGIHEPIRWDFPIATFLTGCIWGWLYCRYPTLIGVTVSHVVLGLWLLYGVGFRHG